MQPNAFGFALLLALGGTFVWSAPALAQKAEVDCARVGLEELGALAGTPVSPADENAAASGLCLFAARSASQDAVVSYALVRPGSLPQRTAYFSAQVGLCAGISPDAPRAALCATYSRLAGAHTPSAYFEARAQAPTAQVQPGGNSGVQTQASDDTGPQTVPDLGDRAVATQDGLVVQRGQLVLEIAVRRQGDLDLDAETKLARLLLERIPAAGA